MQADPWDFCVQVIAGPFNTVFFDRAWLIITYTECTWMVVYEKGELKIIEVKKKTT